MTKNKWAFTTFLMFVLIQPLLYLMNAYDFITHAEQLSKYYVAGWKGITLISYSIKLLVVLYGIRCGFLIYKQNNNAQKHSLRYLKIKLGYEFFHAGFLILPKDEFAAAILPNTLFSLAISVIYFVSFYLILKYKSQSS